MADKLTLAVRMYCMGLGDCFLVRFDSAAGPFSMLVDCGMFVGSPGLEERLRRVVEDIREVTGGTLNLLVVTHQHYDHLSGFMLGDARALWEGRDGGGIKVERVWMGWTEEENGLGGQVREAYKGRAKRLREFLRTLKERDAAAAGDGARGGERPLHALLGDMLGFGDQLDADFGLTASLDEAMLFVKRRVETPDYLHPGEGPLTIGALPGVRFYVLGPPMGEELLNSDPARGTQEAYELDRGLSIDGAFYGAPAFSDGDEGRNLADYPFRDDVGILVDAEPGAQAAAWEKEAWAFFQRRYRDRANSWRQIEDDWLGVVGDLALKLDADTNNTSLALAIELADTGDVLLFPGDAQAGSWRSWHTLSWTLREGHDEREVTARELLRRVVFYKVGHHGSHNATLRVPGLEQMGEDAPRLVAMIPTDEAFARRKGKDGWKMPFAPLYRRLLEKTGGRVIRADHGLPAHEHGALVLPAEVHERLSRDLGITGEELDTFLKEICPGELEWRRFAASVKVGPALSLGQDVYEGPLYYEVDIVR